MTHIRFTLPLLFALLIAGLTGCADLPAEDEADMFEGSDDGRSLLTEDGHAVSKISTNKKRERATLIQATAAGAGFHNAVLLGGIANSETHMAHCWSEARWACKGPASSSCGGGPVIAGSGDGPCANKQGGLGYFQFDAGTHRQTLARYGNDVLTVEGNTRHAVDYVVDMVIRSTYISGVSTRAQALAWLNTVRVDGRNWNTWIRTVVHYYNGCIQGRCGVYNQRTNKYKNDTRAIYRELGHDFWYGNTNTGVATVPAPAEPTPSNLGAPAEVAPAAATVSRGGSIDLSWTAVSGAEGYDLEMDYWNNGTWSRYYTWTSRSQPRFTVFPQSNDTTYSWRVRSCGGGGCSDWSGYAGFVVGSSPQANDRAPEPVAEQPTEPEPTVNDPEPEPVAPQPEPVEPTPEPVEPAPEPVEPTPTGVQSPGSVSPAGGTVSSSSVDLTWSAVSGAVGYDVSMEYQRNGSWTSYYTWTDRSTSAFTVWPQANNTDYRWRVRACTISACSPYTAWEDFYFNGL